MLLHIMNINHCAHKNKLSLQQRLPWAVNKLNMRQKGIFCYIMVYFPNDLLMCSIKGGGRGHFIF